MAKLEETTNAIAICRNEGRTQEGKAGSPNYGNLLPFEPDPLQVEQDTNPITFTPFDPSHIPGHGVRGGGNDPFEHQWLLE